MYMYIVRTNQLLSKKKKKPLEVILFLLIFLRIRRIHYHRVILLPMILITHTVYTKSSDVCRPHTRIRLLIILCYVSL